MHFYCLRTFSHQTRMLCKSLFDIQCTYSSKLTYRGCKENNYPLATNMQWYTSWQVCERVGALCRYTMHKVQCCVYKYMYAYLQGVLCFVAFYTLQTVLFPVCSNIFLEQLNQIYSF